MVAAPALKVPVAPGRVRVKGIAVPGPVTLKPWGDVIENPAVLEPPTVKTPLAPGVTADKRTPLDVRAPAVSIVTVPGAAFENEPKLRGVVLVMVIGAITVAVAVPEAVAAMAAEDRVLKDATTVANKAKRLEDFIITPICLKSKKGSCPVTAKLNVTKIIKKCNNLLDRNDSIVF